MTRSVVVCPPTPLLVPGLGGLVDPVAELRAACHDALGRALGHMPADGCVRVLAEVDGVDTGAGGADAGPGGVAAVSGERLDVARFGTGAAHTGDPLPLGLGVGRQLLLDAGWTGRTEVHGLAPGADCGGGWAESPGAPDASGAPESPGAPDLVVLMAEGSACRGEKAPGFLDERAFGFDDALATAVADGDGAALATLDLPLAAALLADGAAWHALARLCPHPRRATLLHRGDPYGVTWLVAHWQA